MIKAFMLLLTVTTLFGCMTGSSMTVKKDTDYLKYKENVEKVVPRIQVRHLDSNQSIELAVWSNLQGMKNEKSLLIEKGEKIHFIKHKETSVFPTAYEGVIYSENDSLYCSVVSNWVDPVGHSQYMLDMALGKDPISNTKSYWAYNSLALLSSTAGYYYIAKDNPLISYDHFVKWEIIHAIGDAAVLLGVIGIVTDNATLRTGGLGVGVLSKIFNIFENQYIAEYNGYSYTGPARD